MRKLTKETGDDFNFSHLTIVIWSILAKHMLTLNVVLGAVVTYQIIHVKHAQ